MQNAHFYLHHSPFQETLSEKLIAEVSSETKGNPLLSSTVVVRNQGMATWLKRQIASEVGIAMQVNFPQPHTFLSSILQNSPIPPEELQWKIFSQLSSWARSKKQGSLLQYLNTEDQNNQSEMRCYQLAGQMAQIFDAYLLYRPEWIMAWSQGKTLQLGEHESWQKDLWRAISPKLPEHWSQLLLRTDSLPEMSNLPPAIHVFGFSNFAPIYSRFLYLLSTQVPVHIYWLNPVDGYWGDSPDKKKWLVEESLNHSESLQLHHPLLVHLGKMGKEFVHTIYEGFNSEHIVQEDDLNQKALPDPTSQLEFLQQSIRENLPLNTPLTPDTSISIHSCHNPLRELECLKDYLYQIAESSSLDTSNILVMCPSIDDYISSIHSVFGQPSEDSLPNLPYRIADQLQLDNDPDIKHFLKLLQLTSSRCSNIDVINGINHATVLSRYNLTPDDIETITHWVDQAGIRWGLSQEHVNSILNTEQENHWHWQAGLERLILGSTMLPPQQGGKIWNDILPIRDIEGQNRETLHSLYQFVHNLIDLQQTLSQKFSLHTWVEKTHLWIETFFERSSKDRFNTLLGLLENILTLDDTPKVSFDLFLDHIQSLLRSSTAHYGFLSGNITFCEMKPMRAIPSEIICLIGMNQDSFPRQDTTKQFDLMRKERRSADRSIREDDAYAFLESLISARTHLFISYIGRSNKDNSKLEPSTVVQTLIKHCPGIEQQIHDEKLHAFDPFYFQKNPPTSFSNKLFDVAKILTTTTSGQLPALPIFSSPSPVRVSLNDFLLAFTHSAKHYLTHCVEGKLPYINDSIDPEESLELDGLDKWKLKNDILHLSTVDVDFITERQQAGSLPPFEIGKSSVGTLLDKQPEIVEIIQTIEHQNFEIHHDDLSIYGAIPTCTSENIPHLISASKEHPRDLLKLRIYQLILSLKNKTATAANLSFLDSDFTMKSIQLAPDPEFSSNFTKLCSLFRESYSSPLPHFPKTSSAYAKPFKIGDETESEIKQKKEKSALGAWAGSQYSLGESNDEATKIIFPTSPHLLESFADISNTIWDPIFTLKQKL